MNHLITSPGYFETMGMAMRRGRALAERDNEDSRPAIVVNEAFAKRYFANGDALGKRVRTGFGGGMLREIVGIASDVHDRGLDKQAIPTLYIPFRQFALSYGSMAIRTRGDPLSIAPEVRRRIQRLDNSVPLVDFQTLDARLRESLAEPRFYTYLATMCAGMALLFVTLGLYGIVSFSVSRRTSEFGIRMAVGASGPAILRLVLKQAVWMAGLGALIGLWLTLLFARALTTLPFAVRPSEPIMLGAAALVVVLVVLAASYAPARRASRVSPLTALRYD